jgi:hypothetical protein
MEEASPNDAVKPVTVNKTQFIQPRDQRGHAAWVRLAVLRHPGEYHLKWWNHWFVKLVLRLLGRKAERRLP